MKYSFLENNNTNNNFKINKKHLFEYDQFADDDEYDDEPDDIDMEKAKEISYYLSDKNRIFDIIKDKNYTDDDILNYMKYSNINYDYDDSGFEDHVLFMFLLNDRKDLVYYILDNFKVNKELRNQDGNTLLHIATLKQNFDLIKNLINKYHYPVDPYNEDGCTPFELACVKEISLDIAKFLLSKGANINTNNNNLKLTPLMKTHNIEIVNFLIKNNADINQKNRFDKTALFLAIENSDFDKAKILLENNANISPTHHITTKYSIIKILFEKRKLDLIDLTIKLNKNNKYLPEEIYDGIKFIIYIDDLKFLKEAFNKTNIIQYIKNDLDYLPFYFVANNGEMWGYRELDMFEFLLDHSTNINKEIHNYTILQYVIYKTPDYASRVLFEYLEILLKKGADVNIKDSLTGNSPLINIYKKLGVNDEYKEKIIDLLLNNDADVSLKNKDGQSIIYFAAMKNDEDYLRKFLNITKKVNLKVDDKNNVFVDNSIVPVIKEDTLLLLLEYSNYSEEEQEQIIDSFSDSENNNYSKIIELACLLKNLYTTLDDDTLLKPIKNEASEEADYYPDHYNEYNERWQDVYDDLMMSDDEFADMDDDTQADMVNTIIQQELGDAQKKYDDIINSINDNREQLQQLIEKQFNLDLFDDIHTNELSENNIDTVKQFLIPKYLNIKNVENALYALKYEIEPGKVEDFVQEFYGESFYDEPDSLKRLKEKL